MIKKTVSTMTTKQKNKVKQWLWFFGLYISSVALLATFSEIVHVIIPQAS